MQPQDVREVGRNRCARSQLARVADVYLLVIRVRQFGTEPGSIGARTWPQVGEPGYRSGRQRRDAINVVRQLSHTDVAIHERSRKVGKGCFFLYGRWEIADHQDLVKENTEPGAQDILAVAGHIPGKADSGSKVFCWSLRKGPVRASDRFQRLISPAVGVLFLVVPINVEVVVQSEVQRKAR